MASACACLKWQGNWVRVGVILADEFECVFVSVFVRLLVSVSCVGSFDSVAVAVAVELKSCCQYGPNLGAALCDAADRRSYSNFESKALTCVRAISNCSTADCFSPHSFYHLSSSL